MSAMHCRICEAPLRQFLDLGRQPLSDAFRDPHDDRPEFSYLLRVGSCTECSMVQLMQEVARDRMFHQDYPFRTSTSVRMRQHFRQFAQRLLRHELTGYDPFVVEIGCNDGTMLSTVAEAGVRHLGIDPAAGALAEAGGRGVRTRAAFFEESTAAEIVAEDGPADVVYAANTICHLPYLDSVFTGLDRLLKPDGLVIFEDPYLGDVIRLGSFDQIYDEHFYLFSAQTVDRTARRHGFALVDVERLDVHGGELRYTLARTGRRPVASTVTALLAEEAARGLHDDATLDAFAETVARRRDALVELLDRLRRSGKQIAGYGATAKSATVLNYCQITAETLPRVYDTTPAKQGRLTPGTGIPVLPFPETIADYPDYFLLLAWNHAEEIAAKESEFRQAGGQWIRYVPDVLVS